MELGSFPSLAVLNKAVMNMIMIVQISVKDPAILGYISRRRTTGLHSNSAGTAILFSIVVTPFYIPTNGG
jgi:hypothetical protein